MSCHNQHQLSQINACNMLPHAHCTVHGLQHYHCAKLATMHVLQTRPEGNSDPTRRHRIRFVVIEKLHGWSALPSTKLEVWRLKTMTRRSVVCNAIKYTPLLLTGCRQQYQPTGYTKHSATTRQPGTVHTTPSPVQCCRW